MAGGQIVRGDLLCPSGCRYLVRDGVIVLLHPPSLGPGDRAAQAEYDRTADTHYDNAIDWIFASFKEDEDSVRERMVDLLDLTPSSKVLETGSGTGRDSFRIARRLRSGGEAFLLDLSEKMLIRARERTSAILDAQADHGRIEYLAGNGSYLPFSDGYFDAAFHFGGLNTFDEVARALAEMARVVRVGGKVVVGDEAIAPWLAEREYGKIICHNNPLYRADAPLRWLPQSARDVTVRWVIGAAYYLIDFRVGVGPPPLDLDLEHRGRRGGTLRTRYFGALEGVTVEAQALAVAAAAAEGVSVHRWLDDAVREKARPPGQPRSAKPNL